jgi:hypothetical protein
MAELIIPATRRDHKSTDWWSNFFYSCGDWHEVSRVLHRDWNARAEASPIVGEVGKIIFENERDITMFMLRWS